ncbi:DUF5493 family protein [Acidianus manzaensis]|nr:DUF5493 family protein [Acidianus manzaensis]
MMSALGDIIYILGILIPLLGLIVRNYLVNLLGFVMGTVGFLVFAQNQTDISFSASTFYLALLPLAFGLMNFAFFFNWLKEERI